MKYATIHFNASLRHINVPVEEARRAVRACHHERPPALSVYYVEQDGLLEGEAVLAEVGGIVCDRRPDAAGGVA